MAQIQIYGDTNKGCVFFDGSRVEPKFLGTIVASVHPTEANRIVIERTDLFKRDGVSFRVLFRRLRAGRVQNRDGQNLVSDLGYTVQDVVLYINQQASAFAATGSAVRPALDETPNFSLDTTQTSVMIDNGDSFGVNTIKAVVGVDGLIDIVSSDHSGNAQSFYEDIPHANCQINGVSLTGGPQDVADKLNELFTVGPFEQVVVRDPYATMVADVDGIDAGFTRVGPNVLDPDGADLAASDVTKYNHAGVLSTATIDQPGEYFTFDIRRKDTYGFGLVDINDDDGVGDAALFCDGVANSHGNGFAWSLWLHSSHGYAWTLYGEDARFSYGPGWIGSTADRFQGNEEHTGLLADSNVKIRVGIDANSFMHVDYYDVSESRWVQFGRSGYPVAEGRQFKLGIKFGGYQGRLHTAPKVHLLEPEAPTMYFRYVESPDGVFQYPLFATIEEAQYYHKTLTGDPVGQYHEHTYADDPTGTTWYMPDNGQMAGTLAPYNLVFQGTTSLFTEITTLSNADLAPPVFSQADIVAEEGTAVNIQINPVDVTYSTSVSVSPAGSGLVWDGYHMLQGTLADVGADTVYTVTVTRGNSYGSRTGQMTITATDVTPPQTNLTPWTKALDFSGSSERAMQVDNSFYRNALKMANISTTVSGGNSGFTSNDSNSRPWATACVFKYDGHNSNQHIWNLGEGSGTTDDNLYLRISSTGYLYFGWGRSGSTGGNLNECGLGGSLSTDKWWGVYIAHDGTRYSGAQATPANLADAFDIYLMRLNDAGTEWVTRVGTLTTASGNRSIASNWYMSGARMDRQFTGDMTIGGRGANRSFHGKVASFVSTTLRRGVQMPTKEEAEMMITDPKRWLQDYKVGNPFRVPWQSGNLSYFNTGDGSSSYATQVWLMGDGTNDNYSNMIRNQVLPSDQNFTKLNLISMVSNDIQNVTIPGLT